MRHRHQGTFIVSGDSSHTALQSPRFYSQDADGVLLNEWTDDFVKKRPFWSDIVDEDIPDAEVDRAATGTCFEQLWKCKAGEEIDEVLVFSFPSAAGAEADGDRNALAIRRRGIEALAQVHELHPSLAGNERAARKVVVDMFPKPADGAKMTGISPSYLC